MNILLPTVSGVAIAMALSGCVPAHREDCPVETQLPLSDASCAVQRGGDGGQGYTPDAPDAPAPDAPDAPDNGGGSNGGSSEGGSDDENGASSDTNGGHS